MTQFIEVKDVTAKKELEFPIMLRQMTHKETKEYHLKKLHELILKSLEKNPKQEELSEKQKQKMIEVTWRGDRRRYYY